MRSVHAVALDGATSGVRLSVLRSTMRAGAAAPVHVHPDEDETLVFLSGTAVVWAGEDRWHAGAGDTAFLPRGLPHTYLITSDSELLTMCTPSGMERFFRRAGWDLADGAPPEGWNPTGMTEAAAAGGQRILGAPLGPDDLISADLLSEYAEATT